MMKVPEFQAAMERTGVERKCYTTDEVATMLGISSLRRNTNLSAIWSNTEKKQFLQKTVVRDCAARYRQHTES